MKRTLVTLTLLTAIFSDSSAQFEKYSNEFLNIGAGARGLAMGGAQVAAVTDGTSVYWKPAGSCTLKRCSPAQLIRHG
jgi:hypothetical protein